MSMGTLPKVDRSMPSNTELKRLRAARHNIAYEAQLERRLEKEAADRSLTELRERMRNKPAPATAELINVGGG